LKQYICIGSWKRNAEGDIITEFEYNKMPIEAKTHNYKEYIPEIPVQEKIVADVETKLKSSKNWKLNVEEDLSNKDV
jgi:hypothetical protein